MDKIAFRLQLPLPIPVASAHTNIKNRDFDLVQKIQHINQNDVPGKQEVQSNNCVHYQAPRTRFQSQG